MAIGLETLPVAAIVSEVVKTQSHREHKRQLNRDALLRYDQFLSVLHKTIGSKRFFHSLGAMHYAIALADRYQENLVQASAAGLFHDCGRLPKIEQIEAEAKRRGVALPPEDRLHPKVWHALLSAHIAEHDFGIADGAVLRAIRVHPTGDAEMSRLDKIIFLADYVEPTRSFEGLNELRASAEQDLDGTFRSALEHKLRHIQSLGRPMHPRSLRALAAVGGSIT